MATASDRPPFFARVGAVAGPLAALVSVWLTTAGHTTNFREMNASHGWISSVGYGLHSAYLFTIAFSILLSPVLKYRVSSHTLTKLGLGMLCSGAFLNGLDTHASYSVAVFGRILAGFGAGQVMCAGLRLLPEARPGAVKVFEVLLPGFGPLIVAGASMWYGWSNWEGGFLFEGLLALFGLGCVIPLNPKPDPPPSPASSLGYLPAFVLGIASIWYLLQWGQLMGWADDRFVLLVAFAGLAGLIATLWLSWPSLTFAIVREAVPRGLLIGYAGMVQFFQVSETGVFGGLFINVSELERAWQVWPLSFGAAVSLLVGRMIPSPVRLEKNASVFGLVLITLGMAFLYTKMLGWPYWSVLNVVEFNWFSAPQTWEMAPGRFLLGFGFGLIIQSEMRRSDGDPACEARIGIGLQASQFIGAGIGIGLLSTALLAGHQWQYSYTSDRGDIQAVEVANRTAELQSTFAASGSPEAARRAETLMFRSVNYQADALVFADIYAGFGITSAALAALLIARMFWLRLLPARFRPGYVHS
ncbi:MAG: hypothetical protein K8U57_06395 [Planctomycetes bacterium]|nr:hypothetical protein [Planctomycetota bacterium]